MLQGNKAVHHSYWACALEPGSRDYGAHAFQLLKSTGPRADAPQQEKPRNQKPAHATGE